MGQPIAHISPIATSASRDFSGPLLVGRVTPDGPIGILVEGTVFLLEDTIGDRSRLSRWSPCLEEVKFHIFRVVLGVPQLGMS